jgi:hypothetical protein
MFSMGSFVLQDRVHAKFDSHRSRLYWERSVPKRKYNLAGRQYASQKNVVDLVYQQQADEPAMKWVRNFTTTMTRSGQRLLVQNTVMPTSSFWAWGKCGLTVWKKFIKHNFKIGAKHEIRDGQRKGSRS